MNNSLLDSVTSGRRFEIHYDPDAEFPFANMVNLDDGENNFIFIYKTELGKRFPYAKEWYFYTPEEVGDDDDIPEDCIFRPEKCVGVGIIVRDYGHNYELRPTSLDDNDADLLLFCKKDSMNANADFKTMVKVIEKWANGEVYGFCCYIDEELQDSCWGFYSIEEMIDQVPDDFLDLYNILKARMR